MTDQTCAACLAILTAVIVAIGVAALVLMPSGCATTRTHPDSPEWQAYWTCCDRASEQGRVPDGCWESAFGERQ